MTYGHFAAYFAILVLARHPYSDHPNHVYAASPALELYPVPHEEAGALWRDPAEEVDWWTNPTTPTALPNCGPCCRDPAAQRRSGNIIGRYGGDRSPCIWPYLLIEELVLAIVGGIMLACRVQLRRIVILHPLPRLGWERFRHSGCAFDVRGKRSSIRN